MEDQKKISATSRVVAAFLFIAALGHTSASLLPVIAGGESASPAITQLLGFVLWYGLFCMVLASWKGKKRLTGFFAGSFLGLIVYFSVGVFSGYNIAKVRAIDQAVEKSNSALPMMIDESTRLDRISIDQSAKEYALFMSATKLSISEIDTVALEQNFVDVTKPEACGNAQLSVFLQEGYTVTYSYYDSNNVFVASYSIEPDDCT